MEEPEFLRPRFTASVLLLIAILSVALVLLVATARAHPLNYDSLDEKSQPWWYGMDEARSAGGGICCNLADAHCLSDDEWRMGDKGHAAEQTARERTSTPLAAAYANAGQRLVNLKVLGKIRNLPLDWSR